jgi:preprotein translocase subunit SecE
MVLRTLNPTRRSYMLDVIIVLVTIVTFVAFIGFTEGCERL